MSAPHVIIEIRTAREAEFQPEAAVHFLAALPQLRRRPWHKLLRQEEHLSLEIVALNQIISFYCYCPARLSPYIQSLISSSYPEAILSELDHDPLLSFQAPARHSGYHLRLGLMRLKNKAYFPLKTWHDFKDIDPLVSILGALSKLEPGDHAAIQFVIAERGDNWKNHGNSFMSATAAAVVGEAPAASHPQKALIEKKLAQPGMTTGIRLLVLSPDADRATVILETIASGFHSVSQSEGNSLTLLKLYLITQYALNLVHTRTFGWLPTPILTNDELATLWHLPNKKLAHVSNIAWGKHLLGEPPENLPIITPELSAQERKEINPFGRVVYKNRSQVYGLKRGDRRRHMYVIGKTGTGKSTLLANMAINDLKNDEGLCVIDPHGDLVENILNFIPSRRINDVVYFDPADPERTVKINLFEGENVVHRELIASGIVSIFQKLYANSWGPRLEYILRNALLTLLKSEQARMSDIVQLLTDPKFRAKTIENLDDPILKSFWEVEFDKMPDRLRSESISPILNKVGQFVSSPLIRNVVNAHKSSFSVEDIMEQGKILLVNLSQGKLGEDNATLLGAMLITKIQLAAMARVHVAEETRRDFYLYVDEFQNFATQAFNKILSEARKYRLNLVLANQYIAQIPEDVQKAIFGNCGSIISFVMGADDAAVFAKEYGEKYTHEDLVMLGKYQIINKISIDNIISLPFPAITLALAKSSNKNKEKVIKVSRERWAKVR